MAEKTTRGAKRIGRPPKGRDARGNPAPASKTFPQLTVRVPPEIKDEIGILADLDGVSQGGVVEAAILAYVASLPDALRRTLDALRARRRASRPPES